MVLTHDIYVCQPWIFTEIKEQKDWDITSGERFDILKDFVRFGLEHWGSDTKGESSSLHILSMQKVGRFQATLFLPGAESGT
jgi:tRNA-dihydrouridine synthase 3